MLAATVLAPDSVLEESRRRYDYSLNAARLASLSGAGGHPGRGVPRVQEVEPRQHDGAWPCRSTALSGTLERTAVSSL